MNPLVKLEGLKKYFPIFGGVLSRLTGQVKVVDDVSFEIAPGEILGLVGESGCGKTTVGRMTLRLLEPTAGRVYFEGENIFALSKKAMNKLRPQMQIIFQDPYSSLNPRFTVERIIGEALWVHGLADRQNLTEKVQEIMRKVGLSPRYTKRYPHEFSGGQRQRIGIARALALNPKLILCDEPVSALDVSVQSQVLNLMMDLQKDMGLAYLFIAHDLAVVRHVSDRVAIMYLGKIMELADADAIYNNPRHAYTKALISAIPVADPTSKRDRTLLEGDVPSPINPPKGCAFGFRMKHDKWEASVEKDLGLVEVEPGHWVQPCPCCTDL